jgi:hypothetical protein
MRWKPNIENLSVKEATDGQGKLELLQLAHGRLFFLMDRDILPAPKK